MPHELGKLINGLKVFIHIVVAQPTTSNLIGSAAGVFIKALVMHLLKLVEVVDVLFFQVG